MSLVIISECVSSALSLAAWLLMTFPFHFGCQEAQSHVTNLIIASILAQISETLIFPLVHKVSQAFMVWFVVVVRRQSELRGVQTAGSQKP